MARSPRDGLRRAPIELLAINSVRRKASDADKLPIGLGRRQLKFRGEIDDSPPHVEQRWSFEDRQRRSARSNRSVEPIRELFGGRGITELDLLSTRGACHRSNETSR
jgi:hypothetical protein